MNEAANTLRSKAYVKILDVLSEGPIYGLKADATSQIVIDGVLQEGGDSIFINGTPYQADDQTYNFQNSMYNVRYGLPSQPYMPGFPSATSVVAVNTDVTTIAPVIKALSTATIDAAKVTILLPEGLSIQNADNGDLNGGSIAFTISRKVTASSTWEDVLSPTISGKCVNPYQRQYYITRPSTAGTWEVKVTRITADATSAAIRNKLRFDSIAEIDEIKLEYNDTAYMGIMIDAESVGSQIPARSYLIRGIICKIPVNYNENSTPPYTGMWNGTYKNEWSSNPAWILYDLLTNTRYGGGKYGITPAMIDKFSFYNAGVYCDEKIDNGLGGTHKRFTFNGVIAQRDDMLMVLQNVAGMMNAQLVYSNGLISINQDRPFIGYKQLVNKSNVIDGIFNYSSSQLATRTTAVNVTWNDGSDKKYLPHVSTVIADATQISRYGFNAVTRYGFNSVDIAALGCTNEAQALRAAHWVLYTSLFQLENVSFSMGMSGFNLQLGDVVKIYDEDYTTTIGSGRIISATANTVTLDRSVSITGSNFIEVLLPDGKTVESHVITSGTTTLNLATNFTVIPNPKAPFIITSAVLPRQFRITSLKLDDSNLAVVNVEGVFYDEAKYANIESGIAIPAGVYSLAIPNVINPPTHINFTSNYFIDNEGFPKRNLILSWKPPPQPVANYILKWRRENGVWATVDNLLTNNYEILDVHGGVYDVMIYAIGMLGAMSVPAVGSCIVEFLAGTDSDLLPAANLQVPGGGLIWNSRDLVFEWINPAGNTNIGSAVLQDFYIELRDANDSHLLHGDFADAVAAGAKQTYTYSYNTNINEGGPRRSVLVSVQCRDTSGKLSIANIHQFDNPAPAIPTIIVDNGVSGITVTTSGIKPVDWEGMIIWASKTTGFIPSDDNKVFQGEQTKTSISLPKSTVQETYYVKAAWYDNFSTTGLFISGEFNATSLAGLTTDVPTVPTGLALTTSLQQNADGSQSAIINATWVDVSSQHTGYTLGFRNVTSSGSTQYFTTTGTAYEFRDLLNGNTYGVTVRADNTIAHSAFSTEVTKLTSADTTPPGPCSALTAQASFKNIFLQWVNPTDKDLAYIEVYAASTNNRASATIIGTPYDNSFVHSGLTTATPWYYWLRAKDTSGNFSTYFPVSATAGVTATPSSLATADYQNLSIVNAAIANGAIDNAKIADATIVNAKIADATIGTLKLVNGAVTQPYGFSDTALYTVQAPAHTNGQWSGEVTNIYTGWITIAIPVLTGISNINMNLDIKAVVQGDQISENRFTNLSASLNMQSTVLNANFSSGFPTVEGPLTWYQSYRYNDRSLAIGGVLLTTVQPTSGTFSFIGASNIGIGNLAGGATISVPTNSQIRMRLELILNDCGNGTVAVKTIKIPELVYSILLTYK